MKHTSLLQPEHIAALRAIEEDAQPYYFGAMLSYLDSFVAGGLADGRFTQEEAAADLELALWYGYVCLHLDTYEQYYNALLHLAGAEQNAAGCGAWYYRYGIALMYCGKPELALEYAERGVAEEPDYPWTRLLTAKLYGHFGRQIDALNAVSEGLRLVPGDYEFLRLRDDLLSGASLEEMEFHELENLDWDLLQEEPIGVIERRRSVASIVCDRQKLAEIQEALQIIDWQPDTPYCRCELPVLGRSVRAVFPMNEAAVSKLDTGHLLQLVQAVESQDGSIRENMRLDGTGEMELTALVFYWDGSLELVYRDPSTSVTSRVVWGRRAEQENEDEPWPDLIKLYREDADGWLYSECWYDGECITLHSGTVGDTGERRELDCESPEQYQQMAAAFFAECSELGYAPWPAEDYNWVVAQFPIAPIADTDAAAEDDLELRDRACEVLNDSLGWRGLGHVDGWEMGRALNGDDFVLNLYCAVVEIDPSVGAILEGLEQAFDCSRLKIAVCPAGENDYELVYAADLSEGFSL